MRRARLLQEKEGKMIITASEDSDYEVVKDVFVHASINEEGQSTFQRFFTIILIKH